MQRQRLAKPRQPITALGLGLSPEAQATQPSQLLSQAKQGARLARFELQLQLVDGALAEHADDLPLIPGQLDFGPLEGDQPVAAQKVGAKLGHQLALDPVAHRQAWPDRIGEGGQGRQIALDRRIVFGSGMQSAHHLTPTFNRLFGKIIAATNSQSHFQSA